jgi:DNA repair exonuclease SbcCD ATPase subunit
LPEESISLEPLEKKLDKLVKEVAGISKSLEVVSSIPGVIKKIDELEKALKEATSSEISVLEKKIDDLQQYVAGLSVLDERIEELSESFTETKEIVGIIVRQLDDLERKYNKALDEITKVMKTLTDYTEVEETEKTDSKQDKKSSKKKEKEEEEKAPSETEEEGPSISEKLPDTIDGLMEYLLKLANPQTDAKKMAVALELVRDQIPPLIEGHTPVLFQFGKLARELKSYPPTATLNENDIARLNKDLRSWTTKLKELAKSG